MNPTQTDIAYSMLEREIGNLLGRFGLAEHPLAKIGLEAGKKMFEPAIRGYIDALVSQPPDSVDAGKEIIKEDISRYVDGFGERLKAKLKKTE